MIPLWGNPYKRELIFLFLLATYGGERMDLLRGQSNQQAGDQSLATVLYQRHAQAVFLYLRGHLSSREDAEDLLLEVFLCAVEKATPLEFSEQQQRAWLLRVARYKRSMGQNSVLCATRIIGSFVNASRLCRSTINKYCGCALPAIYTQKRLLSRSRRATELFVCC